jgi:hypothetical protein
VGLLATEGEREGENKKAKETIKTKVEILVDMSHEDQVNYVRWRLSLPTPPSQKNNKISAASATYKSRSPAVQVPQLCPSYFKLYKPHFG